MPKFAGFAGLPRYEQLELVPNKERFSTGLRAINKSPCYRRKVLYF